jgi:hypothetical protein
MHFNLVAPALAALWFAGSASAQPARLSGGLVAMPRNDGQQTPAGLEPGVLIRRVPATGELLLRVPPGSDDIAYAASLMATGAYRYVEPDWLVSAGATPNDPLYAQQWHLPLMNAPAAWNLVTGDPAVIIAVCDSGVQLSHPDLASRLVSGYNAVDRLPQSMGGQVDGLTDHGTQVAGAAAAAGNNAVGISGAGWNLRIMPVRVANVANDTALLSDINEGARWAADHGARIVNCSFSGVTSASVMTTGAYLRERGVSFVWAAGNAASRLGTADDPNTLVVSATDQNDLPANFSNSGAVVDLAAPGVSIMTTRLGGGYIAVNGTSFSSPLAAGALGLLRSAHPGLTPAGAEAVLRHTSVDLGAAGRDDRFGAGRIDLGAAAALAAQAASSPVAPLAFDDAAFAAPGGDVVIDLLANDVELNGEPLSIVGFPARSERGGLLELSPGTGPDGRDELRYTPATGFRGSDRFAYQAADPGLLTGDAAVRIDVVAPVVFGEERITTHAFFGSSLDRMLLRDADGDGDLDVFAAVSSGTVIHAFENIGGVLQPPRDITHAQVFGPFDIVDVNHDDVPDLVLAAPVFNTIGVRLGTAPFTFAPASFAAAATSPADIIATLADGSPLDVDGDGNADIAYIHKPILAESVQVRRGDGAGGFGAPTTYPLPITPLVLQAADLAGDARPELVAANSGTNSVSVLRNLGNGNFLAAENYSTGVSPRQLVLTDFDADGDTDIAVVSPGLLGSVPGVATLLTEDGLFSPGPLLVAGGMNPSAAACADFNLDGEPDFVNSNLISVDLDMHLALDGAFLSPPRRLSTALTGLGACAAADLDRDGRADLITSGVSIFGFGLRSAVSVRLNAGTPPVCAADFTGSSDPSDPAYGMPDGTADAADFFYYLDQFVAGNLAEGDLTGSSDPNDPAYGLPDGALDAADFFYYLDRFVEGC